MACEFVSRANLLDILESVGHNLAAMSSPNYWRYEDRGRAKSYEESLAIVRKYWLKSKNGAEPIKVFDLLRSCKIDYANLVYEALQGNFEKTEDWFRNLPKGHHWVTFGGAAIGAVGNYLTNLQQQKNNAEMMKLDAKLQKELAQKTLCRIIRALVNGFTRTKTVYCRLRKMRC